MARICQSCEDPLQRVLRGDPEFGARPIKRAIQRYLLNDLSKQLLAGCIDKEKTITVDAADNMLTFRNS